MSFAIFQWPLILFPWSQLLLHCSHSSVDQEMAYAWFCMWHAVMCSQVYLLHASLCVPSFSYYCFFNLKQTCLYYQEVPMVPHVHGTMASVERGIGRENSKDFFLFFLFSFCSCFQLIPDINCPGSHVAVLWLLQCMRGRKERKAPITYNILYTSTGKKSCILPL